jgi:hypothetical protein
VVGPKSAGIMFKNIVMFMEMKRVHAKKCNGHNSKILL